MIFGCSPSVSQDQVPILKSAGDNVHLRADGITLRGDRQFDFGPILAGGQVLRHDFTLTNTTDRPIHLLKATPLTPCCSSVETLAEVIPPRGDGTIRIILRPGYSSGRKQAVFEVGTDLETTPVIKLAVPATLTPEWEVKDESDSGESLLIGQSGSRTLQVVTRRTGKEGRGSPESIANADALKAAFKGSAVETTLPDGMIESSREVVVMIPARTGAGPQRGELLFQWPDGHKQTHTVVWKVHDRIQAVPSGLVIKRSAAPVKQTITIASIDRSFRIAEVSGELLAERVSLPVTSERTHRLSLILETSRSRHTETSDIQVRTDHPKQPVVTLSILVLPSE